MFKIKNLPQMFISAAVPIVVIVGIVGAFTSHRTKSVNTAQPVTYVYHCDSAYNFVYYLNADSTQTQFVDYNGAKGQSALSILEKCTQVQVKHYVFGDQVISINGTAGTGPKYWSFYVNDKLSSVGAGTYITKDSDKISWKLQKL